LPLDSFKNDILEGERLGGIQARGGAQKKAAKNKSNLKVTVQGTDRQGGGGYNVLPNYQKTKISQRMGCRF
jgi:hypothetical protein